MVAARAALLAVLIAPLAGCDDGGTDAPAETRAGPTQTRAVWPLAAPALLARISLDLRGERPAARELLVLDGSEADEARIDEAVDAWLEDPRFPERLAELFAPVYRTRLDRYPVGPADYGLPAEPADIAAFDRSIGEEPLRLIAHLAREDRPYTELVTADYSLADANLLAAWPLEAIAEPEADGWRKVRYTDGRQLAGVLSLNALYWRYPSNGVNYQRQRANALSRILLCNDYLDRPVDFPRDIDLSDEAVVREAVKSNPGCVSCHVSLDPLASFFFGFTYAGQTAPEMSVYHPERERGWQTATGTAPAFFGSPGYTLRDLGQAIAADPRFVSCAVETVYEGLLGRETRLDDVDALNRHREAFLASGLKLRALVRSIVGEPRYRGELDPAVGGVAVKVASPGLMADQIEALTGYRFTAGGVDMMTSSLFGLATLAGGGDALGGGPGTAPPNATMQLSHERLAQAAAFYVVEREARGEVDPSDALFNRVTLSGEAPDEGVAVAQLQSLHRRIFGRELPAQSEEIVAGLALYEELLRTESDWRAAWAGVLSVLLRDPDFVTY